MHTSAFSDRRKTMRLALMSALLIIGLGAVVAVKDAKDTRRGSKPLATLDIVTETREPIPLKEVAGREYTNAFATFTDTDGTAKEIPLRLRTRGNSTAMIHNKLPYKVKLDEAESLLGVPAHTKFVLLANYFDRALLRNDLAMEAARRIGYSWAPRMVPVEVTLNGQPKGLYQFGEDVRPGPERFGLSPGAELLEADFHEDDETLFFETKRGLRVFLPESDDPAVKDRVHGQFQKIEDLLYSEDFPKNGYRDHIEPVSFARGFLLNELTKNFDSAFMSSVFMIMEEDGTLAMGPPWDYDLSMGNRTAWGAAEPTGWFLNENNYVDNPSPEWRRLFSPSQIWDEPQGHYWNRLMADPWFVKHVRDAWNKVAHNFEDLDSYIDEQVTLVSDAAARNFDPAVAHHPVGPSLLEEDPNTFVFHNEARRDSRDVADPHAAWRREADALRDWLTTRLAWLGSTIDQLT